ncbi:dihydrodipicolinate reductase [Yinghuangia aomiensis]|uniref:Dihydrodipicolinate reductase n=1 Tax=Yinghuangia aomiensis TaxID=676205 RepID=A0ABP9I0D0_9ACTN
MGTNAAPDRPYRVVQWATGTIGARALRQVIGHPRMQLAGLWVHSPDKVGRDASELCGVETDEVGGLADTTGVAATNRLDDILELDADCVLYMPQACDADEVCRLLASGLNVVTTRSEFHRPASMDPDLRRRVEDACAEGGTSIHSTGSSPGFITEAVPLVLASVQRRLDMMTIDEFADLSRRDSPELLFEVMGFGRAPAEFAEVRTEHARSPFGQSLALVADGLGLPLDKIDVTGEFATASRTVEIAAGRLEAGTVAAQRITVTGTRDGEPLLRFRATWYCTTELDRLWDVRPTGWRVVVDGDAPLDIDMTFPVPMERMAAVSPAYTANRAVNAVPAVCGAAPGIRTTLDLPGITALLA